MKVIHISYEISNKQAPKALCIGFFDGVHRGHQTLIAKTVELAEQHNLVPALFTFKETPLAVIKDLKIPHLTTNLDKVSHVEALGIEEVEILDFDKTIADYSATEFIEKILKPLNIKFLICGFDFTFGKAGRGDVELLQQSGEQYGFKTIVIPAVLYQNEKVASSTIAQALVQGDLEKANAMLGYPYTIKGKVVHGLKNGHKFGFPTANLELGNYVPPKNGVYAVRVKHGNRIYEGMANVGVHPTIAKNSQPQLEVNIFDFNQDIYGEILTVEFLGYIRPERKFENCTELIGQINKDRQTIISCFFKHI